MSCQQFQTYESIAGIERQNYAIAIFALDYVDAEGRNEITISVHQNMKISVVISSHRTLKQQTNLMFTTAITLACATRKWCYCNLSNDN